MRCKICRKTAHDRVTFFARGNSVTYKICRKNPCLDAAADEAESALGKGKIEHTEIQTGTGISPWHWAVAIALIIIGIAIILAWPHVQPLLVK